MSDEVSLTKRLVSSLIFDDVVSFVWDGDDSWTLVQSFRGATGETMAERSPRRRCESWQSSRCCLGTQSDAVDAEFSKDLTAKRSEV
jgi:hypothetical protein